MAVPRREVKPQLETGFPGGGGQVSNDVAGPVLPRARADGVVGVGGGPEAEAVVVLGGEDHAREPGVPGDLDPLGGVKADRIEYGRVRVAGAPLGVGEGVGAEVEEHGHCAHLPLELGSRRDGQIGKWRWFFYCKRRSKRRE